MYVKNRNWRGGNLSTGLKNILGIYSHSISSQIALNQTREPLDPNIGHPAVSGNSQVHTFPIASVTHGEPVALLGGGMRVTLGQTPKGVSAQHMQKICLWLV